MGTFNEVLAAYRRLTPEEQAQFLQAVQENDDWDRQMKADAEAGRLDFLVEDALQAYSDGQVKFL